MSTRQVIEYHPTIGHLFIPGIRARLDQAGNRYLIRVNQLGLRSDREYERAGRAGTPRVLVFGDSQTAGNGVSNGARYTDVLEELIPGIEVYNFGIPGTGTDQQLLAFRELAATIEYDLVVVSPWVENIERNGASHAVWGLTTGKPAVFAKPYFAFREDGGIEARHLPVPRQAIDPDELPGGITPYLFQPPAPEGYRTSAPDAAQHHVARGASHSRRSGVRPRARTTLRRAVRTLGPRAEQIVQRLRGRSLLPGYERADGPAWRITAAMIRQWAAEAATPLVVCPLPMPEHIEGIASARHYQARYGELHDGMGVFVHDPLPDLKRRPKDDRRGLWFANDPHFTSAGHRAVAESLAPVIRGLLPAQRAPAPGPLPAVGRGH